MQFEIGRHNNTIILDPFRIKAPKLKFIRQISVLIKRNKEKLKKEKIKKKNDFSDILRSRQLIEVKISCVTVHFKCSLNIYQNWNETERMI